MLRILSFTGPYRNLSGLQRIYILVWNTIGPIGLYKMRGSGLIQFLEFRRAHTHKVGMGFMISPTTQKLEEFF